MIPPLRISLSGGGMRGLAHIGALEVLHERGLLKSVKEYIGISAGSFCAFSLCIGCTLTELRMVSALLDFGLTRSVNPDDIFNFTESFGFDSGENMDKLITVLLKTKGFSPTVTFAALPKKPALRIFATDLNTCMPIEFSASLTPDTEVRQALRASMAIPIYFTPIRHNGHLLVDGGVVTHMPFSLLPIAERESALNITFLTQYDCSGIPSFFSFLGQLYASLHRYHSVQTDNEWSHRTVYLPCGDFPSTNFEATTEEKISLMDSGRKGMEEFLQRRSRTPSRRFSVS